MDARRRSRTGALAEKKWKQEEREKQKEKATVMMHNTMRYGSQKIRDADTRARHVSSRINEGCVHFSPAPQYTSSVFLSSPRDRNLLRKCRYVDEGRSAGTSSVSLRPSSRKYSFRGSCLDCVTADRLQETSFLSRRRPFFFFRETPRMCLPRRVISLI